MRASGRRCCEEAWEAWMTKARQRRLIRALDSAPRYERDALPDPHGAVSDSGREEL